MHTQMLLNWRVFFAVRCDIWSAFPTPHPKPTWLRNIDTRTNRRTLAQTDYHFYDYLHASGFVPQPHKLTSVCTQYPLLLLTATHRTGLLSYLSGKPVVDGQPWRLGRFEHQWAPPFWLFVFLFHPRAVSWTDELFQTSHTSHPVLAWAWAESHKNNKGNNSHSTNRNNCLYMGLRRATYLSIWNTLPQTRMIQVTLITRQIQNDFGSENKFDHSSWNFWLAFPHLWSDSIAPSQWWVICVISIHCLSLCILCLIILHEIGELQQTYL